jgi:hypothetical protein
MAQNTFSGNFSVFVGKILGVRMELGLNNTTTFWNEGAGFRSSNPYFVVSSYP